MFIRQLIKSRARFNMPDNRGRVSAHYIACSPHDFESYFPRVFRHIDVNARDFQGLTPLHWAARSRYRWSNIRNMIALGADLNARDNEGYTPLHHAARFGTRGIIKRLISLGADPYLLGGSGETPLALAARTGSLQGMVDLLRCGVSDPSVCEVSSRWHRYYFLDYNLSSRYRVTCSI